MALSRFKQIIPLRRRALNCVLSRSGSTKSTTSELPSIDKHERTNTIGTHNNNALIKPLFSNRNPRNLEKMTIARKPRGYHLDNPGVEFWHKLIVKVTKSGITAEVIHNSGVTVLTVSTSEYGIRKYLHSAFDTCAYISLGKILAQRCLESGLQFVFCNIEASEGTKIYSMLREAEKGGLSLTEPNVYVNPARWSQKYPVKPWEVIT